MSYNRVFVRFTMGGTVYGGADIWSCGLNITGATSIIDPVTGAELSSFLNQANDIVSEWFGGGNSGISTHAQLEWLKAAYLDEDGKYIIDSEVYDYPTAVTGTYNNATPPQISTVISLTTDSSRGLAHIGRIYPPLSGFIGPDGYIPASFTDTMGSNAAEMIAALNGIAQDVFGVGAGVVVMSKVGTGVTRAVTGVRVGNVLDTQRSRRNAFIESYTYNPLPQF